jgi:hypothetical protein
MRRVIPMRVLRCFLKKKYGYHGWRNFASVHYDEIYLSEIRTF